MKKIALSILLLCATLSSQAQDNNTNICRVGFTYDISQNIHWGMHKPVITDVTPYSSAELAGVKTGDIIETIDGINTIDVTPDEVVELLNQAGKDEVVLTLSNLGIAHKQVTIKKECKKVNSITEEQLAQAFNMYSLETTNERDFTCPFKTTTTADTVDFARFKTFAFSTIDENNRELEASINNSIKKELEKKGMEQNTTEPDVLIQTFYYFDKNPNYIGANVIQIEKQPIYRYNFTTNKMAAFPFLASSAAEAEAEYLLQFGFRLIDQKEVPGRILWECESNEMLENSFKMEEYANIHVPLMLMQYPYMKYNRNASYLVSQKTYNYTGISYDIDRLESVVKVERNSPAYEAGLRAKDVIVKINDNKMDYSAEEFTAGYKTFITNTMKYRDPKTQFTDANGFKRCMFWDPFNYIKVADALQSNNNIGAFSYLYYFTPYVNTTGNNSCIFEIKRGKEKMEIIVRPTIRRELTVRLK